MGNQGDGMNNSQTDDSQAGNSDSIHNTAGSSQEPSDPMAELECSRDKEDRQKWFMRKLKDYAVSSTSSNSTRQEAAAEHDMDDICIDNTGHDRWDDRWEAESQVSDATDYLK